MSATASAPKKSGLALMKQYFLDFGVLKDNPREYWVVQCINLCDMLAYFSMIAIVTVFLTNNIGWKDVHAGYIVTAFTMFVTVSLFFTGFISDALGIKTSVIVAALIQFFTRFGIALCAFVEDVPGRKWIVVACLVLTAPGMAMTQTVFQAANRRFSSERSRSASFNVWYLVMNIGAAVGGFSLDLTRLHVPKWLGLPTDDPDVYNPWIFGVGTALFLVNAVVAGLFIRKRVTLVEPAAEEGAAAESAAKEPKKSAWTIFRDVVRQSAFWRFLVLMAALLGVRAVFVHMYLLMPKYWTRVIGEDAEMGLLNTINPVLIVIGLILIIPIANKFNVFKMLVFGAIISSFSLLVLVLPWRIFGGAVEGAYFRMSVAMMIVLSIGEVIWSPKLQEYTAAIAPKGQEGSYLGMSMIPWFFAKLAVSALSGHMLVRWCPEGVGERVREGTLGFWESPEAMWLILFVWAIAGPLLAIAFKRWLTKGAKLDPVRDEPEAAAA